MTDIVERLRYPRPHAVHDAAYNLDTQAMRDAAAEIERLTKENFALAANQCKAGYSGEHGDHMCRYVEEIERLRAALHIAYGYIDPMDCRREDFDQICAALGEKS